jgi:hypothetical protein
LRAEPSFCFVFGHPSFFVCAVDPRLINPPLATTPPARKKATTFGQLCPQKQAQIYLDLWRSMMERNSRAVPHDRDSKTARAPKRRRCHVDHDAGVSDPFGRLPDELVLAILAALDDPRSLALWAQTSRRHHALANDPSLWHRLCESRFGPLLHSRFLESNKCWRWLYRAQAHVASSMGADIGAVILPACGYDHCVYWRDLVDGLPHGYGVLLQLPTRHCDPDPSPTRTRTSIGDALTPADVGHEGQWRNGQRHGYGIGVLTDGGIHEGGYAYDRVDGHGTCARSDGSTYEGNWRDNGINGYGVYTWPDGKSYSGAILDNQLHGYGTHVWANGDTYEGMWRCNQRDGYGAQTDVNGDVYRGQWRDGVRDGFGVFAKARGTTYRGNWLDGLRHGYGVYTKADGSRYSGRWQHNLREGCGMWKYADGSCIQGRWLHRRLDHGTIIRHRYGRSPCSTDSLCTACATVAGSRSTDTHQEDTEARA